MEAFEATGISIFSSQLRVETVELLGGILPPQSRRRGILTLAGAGPYYGAVLNLIGLGPPLPIAAQVVILGALPQMVMAMLAGAWFYTPSPMVSSPSPAFATVISAVSFTPQLRARFQMSSDAYLPGSPDSYASFGRMASFRKSRKQHATALPIRASPSTAAIFATRNADITQLLGKAA